MKIASIILQILIIASVSVSVSGTHLSSLKDLQWTTIDKTLPKGADYAMLGAYDPESGIDNIVLFGGKRNQKQRSVFEIEIDSFKFEPLKSRYFPDSMQGWGQACVTLSGYAYCNELNSRAVVRYNMTDVFTNDANTAIHAISAQNDFSIDRAKGCC